MPNETPRHILESVPVPIGASERDIRKACQRAIERGLTIRLKLETKFEEVCGDDREDDAPDWAIWDPCDMLSAIEQALWLDGEEPEVEGAGPPHDPG